MHVPKELSMNPSSDRTFLDQWTDWLATDAPRRLAPATIAEYKRQVVAFAQWMDAMLGVSFHPEYITAYRIEQFVATLELQVHRKTRKPATVNKAVAALSSLGAWLVETGVCAASPARRLRTIGDQPGPPKALDPTVVTKLLDAAHHTGDLRDALVLEILAFSGMRASEVAAIQLEDLDVGLRTTWVSIVGKGYKRRRVPLPKRIGTLLQRYLDDRATREGRRPTHGPLLVGERGGLTRTTINRIVTKVAQCAQLTPTERAAVTPHAFRHSVATQLVRKRDLVTAADLLGHSSLSTTRRYSKASAQDLEAAVAALYDPA
jgi:integrase/recombinase XerC